MKSSLEQLPLLLKKKLAPIYLLSGDEILLLDEATELIKQQARDQGYTELIKLTADGKYNWSQFSNLINSPSLFAEPRFILLNLITGKPGKEGGKILQQYGENPAADHILVITTPKLTAQQQQSKWYQTIAEAGVWIPIWPIKTNQLPQFIGKRAQQQGLTISPPGLLLIAEHSEGNLLAIKQTLNKLQLLYNQQPIDLKEIQQTIIEQSQFTIFDLIDSALEGKAERMIKIFSRLQEQGTEATLLLWALARELRVLINLKHGLEKNQPFAELCKENQLWQNRQLLVKAALDRRPASKLLKLLGATAQLDWIIKGARSGNFFAEFELLLLTLAGKPTSLGVNDG